MTCLDGGSASDDRYRWARTLVTSPTGDGPDDVPGVLSRVCRELATAIDTAGVATSLVSDGTFAGVVAASNDWAREVDDLQFTMGEGPGRQALRLRRPILTPDLSRVPGHPWPGYAACALEAGVRAVFAFPLHIGVSAFGVLNVYRDQPGSLSSAHEATALTFVRIANEAIIDGAISRPDGELDERVASALDYRAEIHQAQGMVMVDLGVSAVQALARMRAHAFGSGRALIDVARDIVDGAALASDD